MTKHKTFWSMLGVIVLVAVGIQLIPYGRNHTNPPVLTEPRWDSSRTRELFAWACADCHSNETTWPWYGNIAPMSWLVQRDVDEGREKLNISVAGGEADEAAEKVLAGEMPPTQYTLLHPAANLSTSERQEFIQGLLATFGGEGGEDGESSERE